LEARIVYNLTAKAQGTRRICEKTWRHRIAQAQKTAKIHILLVDDNEAFLRVASDFLQRQHELIVVGAIRGSEEALAQAQDLRLQVILIDLDKSGLETISRLRSLLPDVGIITLTLLNDDAYRQAVLAVGADDLVCKAELVSDLLPAIRRVARAKRFR
jgi:DNA-binding NarL/FixJ family response regulator